MASSGTHRHSKKNSPAVTIELAPADVAAVADELDVKDLEAEDIQPEPASAANRRSRRGGSRKCPASQLRRPRHADFPV